MAAVLSYEHSFALGDDSCLALRGAERYKTGVDVALLTQELSEPRTYGAVLNVGF